MKSVSALRLPRSVCGFLFSVLGLLSVGCSLLPPPKPDLTKYYVLTGPPLTDERVRTPNGSLKIGLQGVELASYLRGRSMIVRNGSNELAFEDYARWAEPLDVGIARMIRTELLASPAVDRVYPAPFPFDGQRDYDVAITILRCEGAKENGALIAKLSAIIEVFTTGADARPVVRKVYTATDRPWNGKDYGALAEQLSEAVHELSKAVVEAVPTTSIGG